MSKVHPFRRHAAARTRSSPLAAAFAIFALLAAIVLPGWHAGQIEMECAGGDGHDAAAHVGHDADHDGECAGVETCADEDQTPHGPHDHRSCATCRLIDLLPPSADLKPPCAEMWWFDGAVGDAQTPPADVRATRITGSVTARGPPDLAPTA